MRGTRTRWTAAAVTLALAVPVGTASAHRPDFMFTGEAAKQIGQALSGTRVRHTGIDVGNGLAGVVGFEGVVLIAEEATAGGPLAGEDRDVARNFDVIVQLMADDRAERGMDERRIGAEAGFDVVRGPFVIAFFADQRTNE